MTIKGLTGAKGIPHDEYIYFFDAEIIYITKMLLVKKKAYALMPLCM